MKLCRKYMAQQTVQPDQWLILNGPEPMPAKILAAIEQGKIEGEAVIFFEDDDAIRADWIEWCVGRLASYEICGEGNAVYYHVGHRWWSECRNCRHAALVQTAVHADLLDNVANVIRSYGSPFFDTRLWQLDAGKFLALPESPAERRVVGIKGIASSSGQLGYSGEHAAIRPPDTHADPSMLQLWKWIGESAAHYIDFYDRPRFNPPHPEL
jgi:hypothetical protein